MHDADFLDIVNSPNDFFDKSEDSSSHSSSENSKNLLDIPIKDGAEFGSLVNFEQPKLKLNNTESTGSKFKRSKINKHDNDLRLAGQRKTDIDRRMMLDMRDYNN